MTRTIAFIGATSGLGYAAVLDLSRKGHRVIAVGRDPRKAERLRRDVAEVITGDISTAAGIAEVVRNINSRTDRLDALVNNAGVMTPSRRTTVEGFELNFAVHHLAPYSMTSALLPLLTKGAGRVVNVNSAGHFAPMRGSGPVEIQFDDLSSTRRFDPFMAYSRSKLANLLFTYELARRRPELTAVAVHPGVVRTSLGREFPRALVAIFHTFAISAERGAQPVVRLAADDGVVSGHYYDRFHPVRSSAASYDLSAAGRLWTITEQLRGRFGASLHPTERGEK